MQAGDRAQGGASSAEPLARRDFSDWRADEIPALERLAEEVARRLRRRLVRRRQRAAAGSELDVRGTLRASLKYGGVPFQPLWRRRRRELPRVFVLVDVSRSMELHARLFLLAARALHAALDARVFVFHTRLAEVTGLMGRPTGRVQEKINAVTFGFGAGTRIATALHEFHTVHGRAALRLRSIVLLFSDGYDTDPPERLRETLAAIAARGARVCWLHPTREPPASLAVQGAATLVDCFAPVYNLESMARLPALLAGRASSNGWPETPPGAVR